MTTSGYLTSEYLNNLTAPFNTQVEFDRLLQTDLGKEVISNLWVNRDKSNPDFGQSEVTTWNIDTIPTSIVGIQVDEARTYALVYYAGLPDYVITEPGITNEPTNQYGILKIPTEPIAETDIVHTLTSSNSVGIFVNGNNIFNYTDTFTWEQGGVWSYEAFVAEAAAINDDGAHSNPTGAFHNHIQSAETLEELDDPFARGISEHSLLIGYGLDGNPVYGPLGYTTTDCSGELKVLRSSYVKRDWLEETTGNRSSLPGWSVANWDDQATSSTSILNLSGLDKSNILYSDGIIDGIVSYSGTDAELAAEIAWYNNAANGHILKEDASGYAYWEHTVTLPDGSGETKTQNYLLKSSDLWGPGYDETIQPGLYPEDRKDEFSFTAAVGSFAEDYEFVEGYGDLDFYNGIDSYIPALGKSEYHYVTTFSSNLTDADRLEGVAFPYVLGIQYKGEVDRFNSDGQTRIDFLADANNGLETVYDLGITGKDDTGNLISGSVIEAWQAEQTVTPDTPDAGMGEAPVDGTTTDIATTDSTTTDIAAAVGYSSGANSNDNLTGGSMDDILVGGNGLDTLTGGDGGDRFTFNSLTEATDVITDFSVNDDLIDLQGVLSGSTAEPFDKFTQFVQLGQVGANTEVQIDADLDGAGTAFTKLVTLNNVAIDSLSAAQFVIA